MEQVNNIHGPEWKLWEQPDEHRSKSLWAFRAAEAARRQGPDAFDRYHLLLLRARHEQQADIADRDVLRKLATEAGLDAGSFDRDLSDRSLMEAIGKDYLLGSEQHGVWGTPTIVLNGGQAAYLKLRPAPPEGEALKLFEGLVDLLSRPYVIEFKRPR